MSKILATDGSGIIRPVTCSTTGHLLVDTNGDADTTVKCMGSEDGTTTGTQKQVRVDGNGRLSVDVNSGVAIATIGSGGHGSGSGVIALGLDSGNNARALLTDTGGRQLTAILGNTAGDGSGTFEHLHTDGNGNLNVQLISTALTQPSNATNSGITDDPANSVAVGLRGRTTITDATTETFLKCDASGVLEVSSSGGGGSSNTNLYPTLASITTATDFAGGIISSNYIDLTNARNVVVNCIFTGGATARSDFGQDIALSMEFTDDQTNTVCYSGASTPVFGFSTIDAAGNSTGDAVAVLSLGDRSDAGGSITGKFGRVVCVNNNNSGTNTAFTINFKVVIDGI